jgi:hypothetical protein
MTPPTSSQIDSAVASLKEGATKLADHLKHEASLRAELDRAATEAEAAGYQAIADILYGMAAKVGGPPPRNGDESASSPRRRGRPRKPVDDQASVT